jgi:hypothetical protein
MKAIAAMLIGCGALFAAGATGMPQCSQAFARHCAEAGDPEAASLEYERLLSVDTTDRAGQLCRLGELWLMRNGPRAERYFERACESAGDNLPARTRAENGLVRAYLFQGKPLVARNELDNYPRADSTGATVAERQFLKAALFAGAYEVDSCRRLIVPLENDPAFAPRAHHLESLLSWYQGAPLKNPLNTYLYSSAIPGWGHWYNGDRKKAVTSFALMGILTGLMVYEAYDFYKGPGEKRYIAGMDLFLVGELLWKRYYNSIRKAAHDRSVSINRSIQIRYQRRLREVLLEP